MVKSALTDAEIMNRPAHQINPKPLSKNKFGLKNRLSETLVPVSNFRSLHSSTHAMLQDHGQAKPSIHPSILLPNGVTTSHDENRADGHG
jgi:hypothetical protein